MPAIPNPSFDPALPLSDIAGDALNDDEASGVAAGEIKEAIEVGSARERGVDDEGDSEEELGVGEVPEGGVGEIVEEGDGDWVVELERESGVANVVFVEKRAMERGGDGAS